MSAPWYEWVLPALVVSVYAGWGICRFLRGRP